MLFNSFIFQIFDLIFIIIIFCHQFNVELEKHITISIKIVYIYIFFLITKQLFFHLLK